MKTKLISILVLALFASHLFAADSALKVAITAQSYDKVKAALDAGADPNEILGGSTILSWAATWGCQANMVKLLIEKGAKVDGVGSMALTPLSAVVWEKNSMPGAIVARNMKTNEKMLKRIKKEVLIANGWWAESDSTKFSTPAEIAKVLLDAGANPNYVLGAGLVKIGTPFLDAVKDFRMDLVKVMLDSKKVDTEYRFDSYAEKSIKVSNKLGAGRYGDANTEKEWAEISMFNTPLLYAIEKGNLELVKILIEGGADINNGKKYEWNESNTQIKTHHWEYWTPLDIAQKAKNPNKEIIDYLISKGAVANRK
jgi:ankyrin repeat protein